MPAWPRSVDPYVLDRARGVRCLILDIDGVVTDGKLYHGPDGGEWKTSNVRDGLGIRRMSDAGLHVAVISGRPSPPMEERLRKLGVKQLFMNTSDKMPAFESLLENLALTPAQCAMMGDDTPDLPLMRRCALGLTVADAHPQVRHCADWVSEFTGGHGAVREACDLLLDAQDRDA